MADFDLDDIYVAVSEEALFAADTIAQRLAILPDSPVYDNIAVQCGRVLKEFFECDHEMGLAARQKIVRGMIERTAPSDTYFKAISTTFMERIETQAPSLFATLHSCLEPQQIERLAETFWRTPEMHPLFLRGSWVDPSNAVDCLVKLQRAAGSLIYIQQCSTQKRLHELYKVHTPYKNANADTQKKEVYRTLYPKKPDEAQLFHSALEELEKSHPDVAQTLLQRFYFMDFNLEELDKDFHYSLVLNAEQTQSMQQAVDNLNAQWKNTPIAEIFCQLWVKDVASRAQHIMEGLGRENDLLVAVEVEATAVDKDKIEQRRASVADNVRRSLNF